jgi:hypothetical protein
MRRLKRYLSLSLTTLFHDRFYSRPGSHRRLHLRNGHALAAPENPFSSKIAALSITIG